MSVLLRLAACCSLAFRAHFGPTSRTACGLYALPQFAIAVPRRSPGQAALCQTSLLPDADLSPPVPIPSVPHDGVHGVHLLSHVLRQRDLAAGAGQIVFRVFDFEVFVSRDVIIQEPGGQLARQRKAAIPQRLRFRFRQRRRGLLQKSLRKRPIDV